VRFEVFVDEDAAVLGGLAEFLSMVIGLRHLVGVAALLYLAAAWLVVRRRATVVGFEAPRPSMLSVDSNKMAPEICRMHAITTYESK
jgi:hypothetical protein